MAPNPDPDPSQSTPPEEPAKPGGAGSAPPEREGAHPPGRASPAPDAPHAPVRSSRELVRLAAWFYAALLAVAVVWALLAGRPLFFASPQAAREGIDPARDLAVGLLAAGVVILLSDCITRSTRWGEALARELAALLGRPGIGHCVLLALLSGVGEEAFFRGAVQPATGLVGASLLFGLAHFVPRRALLPWTGFTIAAGFLLGILFDATGNLLAPIVAHATINAVNLRILTTRHAPPPHT